MKEIIQQKIQELTEQAKKAGIKHIEVTLVSGEEETFLSRVIKTKEQADEFMRKLKALHN